LQLHKPSQKPKHPESSRESSPNRFGRNEKTEIKAFTLEPSIMFNTIYNNAGRQALEMAQKEQQRRNRAASLKVTKTSNDGATLHTTSLADDASSSTGSSYNRSSSLNDICISTHDKSQSESSSPYNALSSSSSLQHHHGPPPDAAWLKKKNNALRKDVVSFIQEDMKVEFGHFDSLRNKCVDIATVATARLEVGNETGATMSIKKLRPISIELHRCIYLLQKLHSFIQAIVDCQCPPDQFYKFVSEIKNEKMKLFDMLPNMDCRTEKDMPIFQFPSNESINFVFNDQELQNMLHKSSLVEIYEKLQISMFVPSGGAGSDKDESTSDDADNDVFSNHPNNQDAVNKNADD
jgi:hypothetical protein